jgi:hypothetical protein
MMTDKPKVEFTEKDLSTKSLDDKVREVWDNMLADLVDLDLLHTSWAFTVSALDHSLPYRPRAPAMIISTPTSPHKSLWHRRLRNAFPHLAIVDEVHQSYRSLDRFHLHDYQREAIDSLLRHPVRAAEFEALGAIGMHVCYEGDDLNIGHVPMTIRTLRDNILPWPEEAYFEYPSIGGQFNFGEIYGVNLIEDVYPAPPKAKAKDWNKDAAFWYRSAMSSKHGMNMAVAAYRAKKNIYSPEFDWANRPEARFRMHVIKHVSVGTVGHIDWGNNRIKHARPYWPGYLAECIRTAIKSL